MSAGQPEQSADTAPVFTVAPVDGVAEVVLNRPGRLNAVDVDLLRAVGDAFLDLSEAAAAGEVRAVVLRGEGRALCAGADLVTMAADDQEPVATMAAVTRAMLAITDCPVPVVCALTGSAAGFGVSVALTADLTVMDASARMVFAFVDVGLGCDGGISQLLTAQVGRQVANRLVLLGKRLDAGQARELGLVAEVVDDGAGSAGGGAVDRAREISATLASRPPASVQGIRRAMAAVHRDALACALDVEDVIQRPLLVSEEFRAAAARFTGR